MAVPKRRTAHGRKKMRQSHDFLVTPAMSVDRKTKSVHRPHHVDLRTGFYRGEQVLFKKDEAGNDGGAKE